MLLFCVADVESGRHHQGEPVKTPKKIKALAPLPISPVYSTHYFVSMNNIGLYTCTV